MKRRLALAAASALGFFATPALAQDNAQPVTQDGDSGFYAGGGINLYFIDKDDAADGMGIVFEDQPSPGAFVGRVGYAFNEYFAVEVEAGIGGAKSEFEGPGIEGDIGVTGPMGAHAVLTMPVSEGGGYLLARAGYSTVTIEREMNGVEYEDLDVSGASFGIGGGVRSGSWDLRAEYSFMSGGDANSGVLSMVALHRF
ncbi:MAG TPA: outer membrane beta-barrel protein [Vitreimonas sp.]|uniref:outer membrane beta-barrel protein n=1 Tax=Vitreimonas sp. TaxID=3069702 RepID=UPI002D3DD74D|nr:outer membrane beta-barrel protein [Vitreimonas sp.]HYD87058.1 outer membrane beta-barrel protein [Vitreimonas sp.]